MHLIEDSQRRNKILLNLLFANHTKWLNTLKHLSAVASVFGHFVGLVLKGLTHILTLFSFDSP